MDMLLRITEDNRVFLETAGETKTKKEVSYDQIAGLFIESMVPAEEKSVALPYGTVQYITKEKNGLPVKETVILEYQTVNRPFKYYETIFASIPFPSLLFRFEVEIDNKKLVDIRVGAVTSTILRDKSIVYHYPYSNVHHDGRICFGSNVLPKIEKLSDLSAIPELFLSGIQNNDLYSNANNSVMVLRELLELLDGTWFDNAILTPMSTYEEFVNRN